MDCAHDADDPGREYASAAKYDPEVVVATRRKFYDAKTVFLGKGVDAPSGQERVATAMS